LLNKKKVRSCANLQEVVREAAKTISIMIKSCKVFIWINDMEIIGPHSMQPRNRD
jgi:hypothetical protein